MAAFFAAIAGIALGLAMTDDDSSAKTVSYGSYIFETLDDGLGTDGEAHLIGFTSDSIQAVEIENEIEDGGKIYKVTGIRESVFNGKINITSAVLPHNITFIGDYAFSGCVKLRTVNIGSQLESIGNYAFDNCSSLEMMDLPGKVSDIGKYAFRGCYSLGSIVMPTNENFIAIKDGVFYDCVRLSTILVPSKVLNIYSHAFYNCTSLKSVEFGSESKLNGISDYAFARCDALRSIALPSNVTGIGNNCFEYCSSLKEFPVPERLSTIGNLAFHGCSSLISFTIPKSVSSIGYGPFAQCKSLGTINVEKNGSFSTSGTVLMDRNQTRIIQAPKSLDTLFVPNTVNTIDDYAFCGCDKLVELNLPSSLYKIGNYAFYGCASLKSIEIPKNVDFIGENVFLLCDSLEKIDVNISNEKFKSVDGVLYSHDSRTLIKYPEAKADTKVTISSIVETIKDSAFFNTRNVAAYTVDPTNASFCSVEGIIYSKDLTRLVAYPCADAEESLIIGNNISNINQYAFGNCSHLKNIIVEDGCSNYMSKEGVLFTKIADELVYYPSGRTDSEYKLDSAVKIVDQFAFMGCKALRHITMTQNTVNFTPMSFSIGSFAEHSSMTVSGPAGYIFPSYAFNSYTGFPGGEDGGNGISPIIIIFGVVIAAILIIAVIYYRRRYSF